MNFALRKPRTRPIHVLVYTAIPSSVEDEPVARTPYVKIRNRFGRLRDFAQWRFSGRWRGHYSTHEDHHNSNRGDICIRLGVIRQLAAALSPDPFTIEEVIWGEMTEEHTPDVVVIAGGGYIFPTTKGLLPARLLRDLDLFAQLKRPVFGASLGLNADIRSNGPFFHPSQADALTRLFAQMTLASVRDPLSLSALKTHRSDLRVVADPALFQEAEPIAVPKEPVSGRRLRIGVNCAFHGDAPSALQGEKLATLAAALRMLAKQVPCEFTYFVHSSGERAMPRALALAGIRCRVVDGPVPMLSAAYARMDIHIAQMLHAAILAMRQGTPVLGLAYDVKSRGFFELMGQSRFCLNAWSAEKEHIVAGALELLQTAETQSAEIAGRLRALRSDSTAFFGRIAETIRATV